MNNEIPNIKGLAKNWWLNLKEQGYGELPVIYSVDDEGNAYHKVYNTPDTFTVNDIEQWSLDRILP